MRGLLAATLVSVMTAACASASGASPSVSEQTPALDSAFTLKPGESASIGPERVRLRFDRVVADSRCPRGARCVRAGDATVRVFLTLPAQAEQTVDLKTTPQGERASAGGYLLLLANLEPLPLAGEPVKASDYRATFTLARVK